MRIVYLANAPRAALTGAAYRALKLAAMFAARGHRVVVAGPPGSALERAAREWGLTFRPAVFRATPRDVRALRTLIRDEDPDVVHAMSTVPLVLAMPRLLLGAGARRSRPSAFVSIVVDPRSADIYASGRPRPAVTAARNRLLRRAAPALDAVFTVSHAAKDALEEMGVRGRLVVDRSMLDVDDLERRCAAEADLPKRHPMIGAAVGQLEALKGVDYLIRAFATLSVTHPGAICVVLGEGSARPALERLAAELGVGDRVFLPGYVKDSAPCMRAFDVFVSPSLTEGLSTVIAEALALRVPTVATDVGGSGELVIDGETGLLVRPADPAALAGAIERLLADPDLAARLATAGNRLVRENHTAEQAFEVVRAEYERALAALTA